MASELAGRLGKFGIWRGATQAPPELAAAVERLGYGTLWLGGSPDGDLSVADELLSATTTLNVGTSIVNMWKDDAGTVAESYARIQAKHPDRFVLGVGAGHPEATQQYASPYNTLATYVDQLLAGGVPAHRLVLAALGPRVLRLAADRTGGAIPYLVPPEHTRLAREILGPDRLLAPEHKAVLDTDAARARALGRKRVTNPYLHLVNYTSNLRRLGFSDEDLAVPPDSTSGGSDRLIDALVAHGSAAAVAAQLTRHLEAGADHVCIQLLTETDGDPVPGYAELASALGLNRLPS
ncbi:MAG TPA: LLM class F420-dependent oxidoreductase [Streptosporangiaceae bacterium]|nr:LLM class F420-dependent oxidoreductase [Streptosporangiaceae bacterium]